MDEEKEKSVGSKFAACMWIYTKEALRKRQIPNPTMEEHLKKRMLSIMLCTNWVCAGTFVDHEWVSHSTLSPACERSDGHGTGLRNWYSVRGTMVHVMVRLFQS